jgi:hypothetical protein
MTDFLVFVVNRLGDKPNLAAFWRSCLQRLFAVFWYWWSPLLAFAPSLKLRRTGPPTGTKFASRHSTPRGWTIEYVRHGTQTLSASASVNIATGTARMSGRGAQPDVLGLSGFGGSKISGPKDSYIIRDNPSTHKNEAARKGLEARRVVSFHFTFDPCLMGKLSLTFEMTLWVRVSTFIFTVLKLAIMKRFPQ